MTFKPNLSVKEALDHLAKRLDPIISSRLEPTLNGLAWTAVLDVLDEKKGHTGKHQYQTHDLQAQLRMLTERIGDLGYPFDDFQRTVSTLGGELRIVRNQLAHMHDFSIVEAFRASDFCVRLLEFFADDGGLTEARTIRHRALSALAAEAGVTESSAASNAAVVPTPDEGQIPPPAAASSADSEPEEVTPDPEMLEGKASMIGSNRLEFESWVVVPVGTVDVLDDLPKKAAKEKVRAVAVEIATYEGPIQLARLVEKTAQSFGLQRLHAGREKKLSYQIRQAGLFVDADKFVWPTAIDPGSWTEFRPSDSNADRPFVAISPVEIANAASFIQAKRPEISDSELDVAILQTFGRKRRTRQLTAHLAKARQLL